VNDKLKAAGTFDRLLLCPDGRVRVADLKSGKSEAAYPFATTVQIAAYAHSLRYDPETGERSSLHAALDLTTGLLIHLPPSGGCQVIPLDLELGWAAAQCAVTVRQFRALKAEDIIRKVVA
jgi:RecB family exonuclease